MIQKIIWDEFYLIGVEEIDVQHKRLTEMVNKCIAKANGMLPEEKLDTLLEDLWFYTKWHFNCEESLMNLLGYPKFTQHKNEHEELLMSLDEKVDQIIEQSYLVSDLREFLQNWLGEHAHGYDKDLGAFVISKWN